MISDVIVRKTVRSLYQPIVRLSTGEVVGFEALARGPEGPLSNPLHLFSAAAEAGCVAELDGVCWDAALAGASDMGLAAPLTLFVNVEPEVLDRAALGRLAAAADLLLPGLQVVLEITERSLVARPAELLSTVELVRERGWRIALDDVGADAASLTFMPFLAPEVVKLDLRLVQLRPGPAVAEIMNAVNAYAERSGAVLLAEGIETRQHLEMAMALGASLGQGWRFGRPTSNPDLGRPASALQLPAPRVAASQVSPFECIPYDMPLRRSPKSLLVEVSKQLEREAMRLGRTCAVASTFEQIAHFTPETASRYRDLAERTGFVCAFGDQFPLEPAVGVRGANLAADDPVRTEWDVVVLSPHFSAALLARDLGYTGRDRDRPFEFVVTYDRDTVVAAGRALLSRVAPQDTTVALGAAKFETAAMSMARRDEPSSGSAENDPLLRRALAATSSGVTIADMTRPDHPLVYVNDAFEHLTGIARSELLGRNCRFMQGDDTDRDAIARLRSAIAAGREACETLRNYRGPERVPWWNEIHFSPVRDATGRVVQYIGVQNDITARVRAQRTADQERERARRYLAQIEQMAHSDALTGLMNRRRIEQEVEAALEAAQINGRAVALLYLDLDDFKPVNDCHGHTAGDRLLRLVGQRVRSAVRPTDLLARLGGDEFLVALLDLDEHDAPNEAQKTGEAIRRAVAEPSTLDGHIVAVTACVGAAVCPADGNDFGTLLHAADLRMYQQKRMG